jgi:hypothetical protein
MMNTRKSQYRFRFISIAIALGIGILQVRCFAAEPQPEQPSFDRVQIFLTKYCADCHSGAKPEGHLNVQKDLESAWTRIEHREKWIEVYRVLVNEQMPPDDSIKPTLSETSEVIDWITTQAIASKLNQRSQSTPLRRLTRDQYQRTIRSLLGIELDVSGFPLDPPAGGFDNNARSLSLSPMHLELYIAAASRALDLSLVKGEQPKSIRWRFEVEDGKSDDSYRVKIADQNPIVNSGENTVQDGWRSIHHAAWNKNLNVRDFHAPAPGPYAIRFRAASHVPNRAQVVESVKTLLRANRIERLKNEPNSVQWIDQEHADLIQHFSTHRAYEYGQARAKIVLDLNGQPTPLGELDVDTDLANPKIFEFPAWIEGESVGMTIEYAYSVPRYLENFWLQDKDEFARPNLLVDWMEIEGPVYDSWPPKSHRNVIASHHDQVEDVTKRARAVLSDFMPRAFRRPVSPDEIEQKLALFDSKIARSEGFVQAIRKPLIAVLVSPHFLYLTESLEPSGSTSVSETKKAIRYVDDYQYASRLSYFLWGTMPDEELLQLAKDKKLRHRATIHHQIDRMLADPKSDALTELFASQWLGLASVGANPPAAELYPDYDRHLEISMIAESKAFFSELLQRDRSVLNFVKSDFVVVNERMARHYGIDHVKGDAFRVVPSPINVHRGGLVTQAAMLSTTSNGTRTSPVKRGTWILKNILGTDPGLPIDNVGDIAPKVPGIDKATVRQRLEIHRELPQCARCHNKIDPLGFSLENFSASGQWRDQEGFGYNGRVDQGDPKIDASSKMPDGTPLDGVDSMQAALLTRQDLFLRCFTEKWFTYAIAREISIEDRPHIDSAVATLKRENLTIRSLLKSIALSPLFTKVAE